MTAAIMIITKILRMRSLGGQSKGLNTTLTVVGRTLQVSATGADQFVRAARVHERPKRVVMRETASCSSGICIQLASPA